MTSARPSTVRKITPKTEKAREEKLDSSASLRVDGATYTIRPGDITGTIERDFRREVGMSMQSMMTQMYQDPGLDLFAAFLYLAKILRGDETTYEAELGALSYECEIDDDPDLKPDPAPEA